MVDCQEAKLDFDRPLIGTSLPSPSLSLSLSRCMLPAGASSTDQPPPALNLLFPRNPRHSTLNLFSPWCVSKLTMCFLLLHTDIAPKATSSEICKAASVSVPADEQCNKVRLSTFRWRLNLLLPSNSATLPRPMAVVRGAALRHRTHLAPEPAPLGEEERRRSRRRWTVWYR